MNLKEIILKYISIFNKQDTDDLKLLFDKKIRLQDWEINVKGIKKVINANKNIFKTTPTLKVKIEKIYCIKKTAICILNIRVNKKKFIKVVDIIDVNDKNKIISIRAYKG
jgi:hypothetical protein